MNDLATKIVVIAGAADQGKSFLGSHLIGTDDAFPWGAPESSTKLDSEVDPVQEGDYKNIARLCVEDTCGRGLDGQNDEEEQLRRSFDHIRTKGEIHALLVVTKTLKLTEIIRNGVFSYLFAINRVEMIDNIAIVLTTAYSRVSSRRDPPLRDQIDRAEREVQDLFVWAIDQIGPSRDVVLPQGFIFPVELAGDRSLDRGVDELVRWIAGRVGRAADSINAEVRSEGLCRIRADPYFVVHPDDDELGEGCRLASGPIVLVPRVWRITETFRFLARGDVSHEGSWQKERVNTRDPDRDVKPIGSWRREETWVTVTRPSENEEVQEWRFRIRRFDVNGQEYASGFHGYNPAVWHSGRARRTLRHRVPLGEARVTKLGTPDADVLSPGTFSVQEFGEFCDDVLQRSCCEQVATGVPVARWFGVTERRQILVDFRRRVEGFEVSAFEPCNLRLTTSFAAYRTFLATEIVLDGSAGFYGIGVAAALALGFLAAGPLGPLVAAAVGGAGAVFSFACARKAVKDRDLENTPAILSEFHERTLSSVQELFDVPLGHPFIWEPLADVVEDWLKQHHPGELREVQSVREKMKSLAEEGESAKSPDDAGG